VLESIASDIGETVVVQAQADARLGTDWPRLEGPAADGVRQALGTWSWWIELDGVMHVGARTVVDAGEHEVLDFDPGRKIARVAVDRLDAVVPGSRLRGVLLEAPFVVEDIEAKVSGGTFVLVCTGAYEASSQPSTLE